jgi:hypothetical protein
MASFPTEFVARLLEMSGLGVFIWFCIRGLQQEIKSLRTTAEVQKDTLMAQTRTLDAMERRVLEAEKIGALYKGLIEELPGDLDKYKAVLRELKDHVIEELEQAVRRRDEQLAELTRSRLDEIEKQEKVLDEVPALRADLVATFQALEGRLSVLDLFQPGTPLRKVLAQLEGAFSANAGPTAIETDGTALLPAMSRRTVRSISASLAGDQSELVVSIPEVVVGRTELHVAPDNEVRAVLKSSSEVLIKRRELSRCSCIEVDVQIVEY